jgi:hypothetical protein
MVAAEAAVVVADNFLSAQEKEADSKESASCFLIVDK